MSKSNRNNTKNETTKIENPQRLPLDKLYIKVFNRYGARDIKAIDPFWIPDCIYPKYYPLAKDLTDDEIHSWLFKNNSYLTVLKMFFNCSYQEFWSIVVYEPAFPIVLESFLKGAIPPYLPQPDNELISPLYSDIYSLVFAIYKRLLTFHNSETEYMEPSTVSVFLYDNSVIKIETVVQLIKLYGPNDDGPLLELILTIFDIIPTLNEHLQICASHFYNVFESISAEAYDYEYATAETATQLCLLLYNTTFCLRMIIKVYEPFKKICIENGLISKIVYSYEEEIPLVGDLVKMVTIEESSMASKFLKNAKIEILEVCHTLLCTCFDLLLQSQDTKWLSLFLDNIDTVSKNKKFAASYNSIYTIYSQLEMLKMIFPDYLYNNDRYEKLMFIFGPQNDDDLQIDPETVESDNNEDSSLSEDEASSTSKKNIIMDAKIKEIIEILPYYGDGFIERCLEYYEMNTERVIEAVLNPERLPPELAEIDFNLPRIPPEEEPINEQPLLPYKGKKNKYKNFNELLNDKTELHNQKERYQQYNNEEWYESLYNDDYESDVDEYAVPLHEGGDILDSLPKKRTGSDTEQKNNDKPGPSKNYNRSRDVVGPKGQGSLKGQGQEKNNNKNLHRNEKPWQKKPIQNGDVESSSGEEEEERRPNNAFCENPEVIRARREAAYQSRGKNRSRDMVGNPKGQGQEKNVQINRENKNKNKSARGNHNRRAGAAWKRNRGMVPS